MEKIKEQKKKKINTFIAEKLDYFRIFHNKVLGTTNDGNRWFFNDPQLASQITEENENLINSSNKFNKFNRSFSLTIIYLIDLVTFSTYCYKFNEKNLFEEMKHLIILEKSNNDEPNSDTDDDDT